MRRSKSFMKIMTLIPIFHGQIFFDKKDLWNKRSRESVISQLRIHIFAKRII